MSFGFPYRAIDELYAAAALPARGDISVLKRPVEGKNFRMPNAFVIQPMEACDAEHGAPGPLTYRRYERFARGGAGLIWVEAIAVSQDAMANPNQLCIDEGNVEAFRAFVGHIRALTDAPLIAQLTHSGRFSKPVPARVWRHAAFDARQGLEDKEFMTDEALSALPDAFARATKLCREAGFDGVDVKACHLYLHSECLSAKDRPGRYGGSFENRTRSYFECVDAARTEIAGGVLAARINVYDGEAGTFGNDGFDEPERLIDALVARGATLLNITMGTPYLNPHVNRPYARGGYEPPEAPVKGVARLLSGCAAAQRAAKDAVCVATGLSYLRHFAPEVAAGLIETGGARGIGFGRGAFAYPDFAHDIIEKGAMDSTKCCVTCGLCTVIMRAGGRVGCPVRDAELYAPELRRVAGRQGS